MPAAFTRDEGEIRRRGEGGQGRSARRVPACTRAARKVGRRPRRTPEGILDRSGGAPPRVPASGRERGAAGPERDGSGADRGSTRPAPAGAASYSTRNLTGDVIRANLPANGKRPSPRHSGASPRATGRAGGGESGEGHRDLEDRGRAGLRVRRARGSQGVRLRQEQRAACLGRHRGGGPLGRDRPRHRADPGGHPRRGLDPEVDPVKRESPAAQSAGPAASGRAPKGRPRARSLAASSCS